MGPAISRRSTLLFGNRLLLDQHEGAAAAYSLRKLNSSATNAVRVLRTSDAQEQDIGFDGNDLDTSSLLSFVGAGDGLITTWYDQSGNSNDATQATQASMPKLVDSGSLVTENGKAALDFDGVDDKTVFNLGVQESKYTFVGVFKIDNQQFGLPMSSRTPEGFGLHQSSSTGIEIRILNGSNFSTKTYTNSIFDNAVSLVTRILIFGVSGSNHNSGNYTVPLGFDQAGTNRFLDGSMQEIILYPSDQSSNRTPIESNINNYYSIY